MALTPFRLGLRGLRHYRAQAAASALGVAVASMVIVGSLLAGSSVHETVRRRVFGRLGNMTHAVHAARTLPASLADRVARGRGVQRAVPVLILEGVVSHAETGASAPRAQIVGVPAGFFAFYAGMGKGPAPGEALASEALAAELGLRPGDDVLLRVVRPDELPSESLFARRRVLERLQTLRLTCSGLAPQEGPGGFSLMAQTGSRRTLLVPYDDLAERLGLEGQAHAILVEAPQGLTPDDLQTSLQPEDLGLRLEALADGAAALRSRNVTLPAPLAGAMNAIAVEVGAHAEAASIMLATEIGAPSRADKGACHYIVVAWAEGVSVPERGIVLTRWLAEDLRARPGDGLEIAWQEPERDGSYRERRERVRVQGVVPTERGARMRWAVPEFPGITDAERVSDWSPPFPVDLRLVTPRDERFWDLYRAAPRAFVSRELIRRMWEGQSASDEWLTAVRFSPRKPISGGLERALAEYLRKHSRQLALAPQIRHLREEAERASQGSTDFQGLMLGLSMFLVASALGLTAAMMRLSAQRRASEIGLLLTIGWRHREAALAVFWEGAISSVMGALAGLPAGIGLAAALVRALNTWWSGAVAREPILLALSWPGLATGFAAAALLGTVTALVTARGMARREPLALLSGWRAVQVATALHSVRRGQGGAWLWAGVCLAALATFAVARGSAVALLMAGAGLMIGGLGLLGGFLGRSLSVRHGSPSLRTIAVRNAALHRGHSVLLAGMVAAACFLVVTVAANVRSAATLAVRDRSSGAGGFDLIVRSPVPLPVSLDTPAGRRSLGFQPEDERWFAGAEIYALRASDGVDVSCLNLARPTEARVLGVPEALIRRGGFTVRTVREAGRLAIPWMLLKDRAPSGRVPAFGDAESVRWILKSRLGGIVRRSSETGEVELELRGVLAFSIFAGELLISEEAFRQLFPGVTGPSVFLIRTADAENARPLAQAIRRVLGEVGVEVRSTGEVLAEVLAVQNSYLAAFLMLGGLAFALGMAGLGSVVLRTAAERRSEFAALAAMGFPEPWIARLLVMETIALLAAGGLLGTTAALLASLPRVVSGDAAVNWSVTAALLAGSAFVGVASAVAAARAAMRGDLLRGLRSE